MRNNAFIVLALALIACLSPLKAQELLNYPLDTVNGEEVYRYEVERSIGLYRVGVNFDVPQSEIIRLNPQLRERGLHYGEIILIPTKRPVIIQSEVKVLETIVTETVVAPEPQPAVVDSLAIDSLATDSLAVDSIVPDTRRVVELALLLPFESRQTKRSVNAERMMEFYQGALLAIHDLQNDSTLYRLRVYDSERSERRVAALCDSTELDSVQAILGLVYPIQIERMATWCEQHKVPLLLPFSDDLELEHHPYILQFNSTDEQEADSLCAWLKTRDAHCVVVEVRDEDLSASVRTLRKQMRAHGIPYTALGLQDLMADSANYALNPEKENIILLHSDRYQLVRMAIPHIAKLQEDGYRIRLISQFSWTKENLRVPTVYTSLFSSNALREEYDELWKTYFSDEHVSETPRYDLLGYDLMQALVAWLQGEQQHIGLQSPIRWQQVKQGGYQNACVEVVTY
jgi:hypothetical protein